MFAWALSAPICWTIPCTICYKTTTLIFASVCLDTGNTNQIYWCTCVTPITSTGKAKAPIIPAIFPGILVVDVDPVVVSVPKKSNNFIIIFIKKLPWIVEISSIIQTKNYILWPLDRVLGGCLSTKCTTQPLTSKVQFIILKLLFVTKISRCWTLMHI